MSPKWSFHAVCATNAFGFTWNWQCCRPDGSTSKSRVPFDYYYDCIEDARKLGYRGPLPAGPSVALGSLPGGSGAPPEPPGVLTVRIEALQSHTRRIRA
jgi:hypothetical protein